VEVETAEGIKTLDCVKHPWGWSDEFEVIRLHESATSNIKYTKAGNTMVKRLNEIRYGDWKHALPNNPTDYERLMNYVESIIHACDLAREEADVVLMHLEESEDFFSDERNLRYYDFDKKMNEIAKIIEQIEQVKRKIKRLEK
jgi:hypothetical protein